MTKTEETTDQTWDIREKDYQKENGEIAYVYEPIHIHGDEWHPLYRDGTCRDCGKQAPQKLIDEAKAKEGR